jgi:3',5'-cyclic AMP phosphodiesterase CpdA
MDEIESGPAHGLGPKQPGEFRVAHLSDLHLTHGENALQGRIRRFVHRSRALNDEIFEAVVADLERQGIDHLVITGDLTSAGSMAEFAAAREILSGYATPDRLSVVPGNHDVSYNEQRVPPTAHLQVARKLRKFFHFFGDVIPVEYPPTLHLEANGAAFPWVKLLAGGTIALIGIDTTIRFSPRLLALNSLGNVDRNQVEALEKILTCRALRPCIKVVAMHHHPMLLPFARIADGFMELRRSKRLMQLFYRCRADLVIHGHKHIPFCWQSKTFKNHDITVVCAAPPGVMDPSTDKTEYQLVYNIYAVREQHLRIHYQETLLQRAGLLRIRS